MKKSLRFLFLALLLALTLMLSMAGTARAAVTWQVDGSTYQSLGQVLSETSLDSGDTIIIKGSGLGDGGSLSVPSGVTVTVENGAHITDVNDMQGTIDAGGASVTMNTITDGTITNANLVTLNGLTHRGQLAASQVNFSGNGNKTFTGAITGSFFVTADVLTLGDSIVTGTIESNAALFLEGDVTVGSIGNVGGNCTVQAGATLKVRGSVNAGVTVASSGTLDVTGAYVANNITADTGSTVIGLYTLSFNLNGGTLGGMSTVPPMTTGTGFGTANQLQFTLPAGTPTHPQGWAFRGWEDSGGLHTSSYTVTANGVTLTASWDASSVAPTITSANSISRIAGQGGSFAVTATGNAPISFSLVGAPAGVSVDAATGVMIIGASVPAGTYTFTVLASNGIAPNATQAFTLKVSNERSADSNEEIYEPVLSVYEKAIVVGVDEYANVREGPSTEVAIIGQVKLGESISLLQWNSDETWCKISYDGDTRLGWLYFKFIKPVK